jgi:hypothetical protein
VPKHVDAVNDCTRVCIICAFFLALSQNCEKRLLAASCLSVRMKQLESHWTDFDNILYLWLSSKICQENFSLKFNNNNGYFICKRFHICDNISLNYT